MKGASLFCLLCSFCVGHVFFVVIVLCLARAGTDTIPDGCMECLRCASSAIMGSSTDRGCATW